MIDPTPDPALVDLVAEALGARRNGLASDGRGWFRTAADRVDCYADATAVLSALATAGWLRPGPLLAVHTNDGRVYHPSDVQFEVGQWLPAPEPPR